MERFDSEHLATAPRPEPDGIDGVPTYSVKFGDPEVNRNPYPILQHIRELGPVVYNPVVDWWMVGSHRLVSKIQADWRRFGNDVAQQVELFGAENMECMDNPRHDEVRGIWSPGLQRDSLQERREMLEVVIEEQLDSFCDRLAHEGTVDAVRGFCRQIPMLVVANLLGIPRSDVEQLTEWSYGIAGILDGMSDPSDHGGALRRNGAEAVAHLNAYAAAELEKRRRASGLDDFISKMAHTHVPMHQKEMESSITQIIFAGHETTATLMAHTLVTFAQHPDQLAAVIEDRSLIPQALEEVHRFNTIICANWRQVRAEGVDIDGVPVPNGAMILNLQAAANRDPRRWDEPDRFDIFRPQRSHVGFAFGMHSCIGLNLARLESQIWFDKFLDRLPRYRLAVDPGELEYGSNFIVRGPLEVPIVAEPGVS